jgi:hypothetical protein
MTRRPASSRSFLRKLAEPIPRTVAPLVSRGPAAGRGAASPSTLDLIPPILEVTETNDNSLLGNHDASSPASTTTKEEARRSGTSSPHPSAQSHTTSVASPRQDSGAAPRVAQSTDPDEPVPQSSSREILSARHEGSVPEGPPREFASPQSFAEQILTSHPKRVITQSNVITSKQEQKSWNRVHIGTVEVHTPAQPSRSQQPGVRGNEVAGRRARDAASRPTEPLARSLAWNHGLVQG